MKAFFKAIIIVLTITITTLIVIKIYDYLSPNNWNGFLSDKRAIFNGVFKYGFYGHIFSTPLLILIALFQLLFQKFKNQPLHKLTGKIYVIGVLVISGPSAIILSFYAFGGLLSILSFFLLSSLWIITTLMGLNAAKVGDIQKHKNFMTRSFVLCFSAILLRILLFFFGFTFNWHGPTMYTTASWLSWTFPLISCEVYLKVKNKKKVIHTDDLF